MNLSPQEKAGLSPHYSSITLSTISRHVPQEFLLEGTTSVTDLSSMVGLASLNETISDVNDSTTSSVGHISQQQYEHGSGDPDRHWGFQRNKLPSSNRLPSLCPLALGEQEAGLDETVGKHRAAPGSTKKAGIVCSRSPGADPLTPPRHSPGANSLTPPLRSPGANSPLRSPGANSLTSPPLAGPRPLSVSSDVTAEGTPLDATLPSLNSTQLNCTQVCLVGSETSEEAYRAQVRKQRAKERTVLLGKKSRGAPASVEYTPIAKVAAQGTPPWVLLE